MWKFGSIRSFVKRWEGFRFVAMVVCEEQQCVARPGYHRTIPAVCQIYRGQIRDWEQDGHPTWLSPDGREVLIFIVDGDKTFVKIVSRGSWQPFAVRIDDQEVRCGHRYPDLRRFLVRAATLVRRGVSEFPENTGQLRLHHDLTDYG